MINALEQAGDVPRERIRFVPIVDVVFTNHRVIDVALLNEELKLLRVHWEWPIGSRAIDQETPHIRIEGMS